MLKAKKMMFPLSNLQLFADDGADPEVPEDDVETPPADGEGGDDPEIKTFTQEEVDKIIKGRLAKERKSWEKTVLEEKTEAEKLAAMSEKEKKEYAAKKKEESLTAREQEITRRELSVQAKDQLADLGLPSSLADVLNYQDADTCSKSIQTVSKAFQEAVEKAVEDRIKGNGPLKKAPSDSKINAESIRTMSAKEINDNWDEVERVLKENN